MPQRPDDRRVLIVNAIVAVIVGALFAFLAVGAHAYLFLSWSPF